MKGFQPNITSLGFTRPAKRPVTVLSEIERHVVLNGRKHRIRLIIVRNRNFNRPRHPNISIESLHKVCGNMFH